MAKEYFELNFPKNPWMISTILLAIAVIAGLVLFYLFYGGSSYIKQSPTSVSPNQAGKSLVSFLNANTNATVTLENVTTMSGIYQVNINYQGRTLPLYTTKDGRYFIQSIIPI